MIRNLSKKEKRLLIVLGVVVVYALFDFVSNFDDYRKAYTGAAEAAAANEPPADTVMVDSSNTAVGTPLPYKPGVWKRDPFQGPRRSGNPGSVVHVRLSESQPPSPFRLKAVSIGKGGAIALINDRFVREGETLHGFRVVSIAPGRVILNRGNRYVTLEMP